MSSNLHDKDDPMLKKILRSPYPYIFLLTYYGVWLIWEGLRVPFSNPLGIISSLPTLGYNPSSNILRFAAAVGLPPTACLVYWLLQNQPDIKKLIHNVWIIRGFKVILVLFPLVLSLCMGIAQSANHIETNQVNGQYGGPYKHAIVDTFHEGETLGFARSYEDPNLKPYRDYVFLHGVFQDPLRSVIAFKLFGRTIGATRAFASILSIATFLLYYVLLLVIFRRNLLKAALGMALIGLLLNPSNTIPILYPYFIGVFLPFRDIMTILFLMAGIIGFRHAQARNQWRLTLSSASVGFVAVVGFANSIDRAFYILALSAFWILLQAFMTSRKLFLTRTFAGYLAGAIVGMPLLGLALKWDFRDFISFLMSIASHKEYLDGIKFIRPDAQVSLLLIIIGAILTLIGASFIQGLSKRPAKKSWWRYALLEVRIFIRKHHLYLLLLVTGVVFMRSAIGRASLDHFSYSVTWLYLALGVIGITAVFRSKGRYLASFVTCLLLLFITGQFVVTTKKTDLRNDVFPIHIQDKDLVRTDHQETADFLKNNLKGNETFVTLTSEATWYYLVDKPSPVKYPVIWFAFMPEERKNLAKSLAKNENIKYVITNNNWTSNFDYVPNDQRFPELYEVLRSTYVPAYGFGQQTVWQRLPR